MDIVSKKPRILCVDDDPHLLHINTTILQSAGYEVLETSTGNECLRIAQKAHPDLILLDVNLPDINGLEICRQIKAVPELSDIFIILISGVQTSSESRVEGLETGADGYIVRPVPGHELLARIQAMIRIKEAGEALKKARTEAEEARLFAEAANRAKSEFLANISHELTTPLNSIIGFSQVLMDELYGTMNAKQKEYVSDILNSGVHLLSLLNNMIELSKIDADKVEIKVSKFLLKDILKSTMTMFSEKALQHNIKLILKIEPDADIEMEADTAKLSQIMFNLLSNAVKFTPDGGTISVHARLVNSEQYLVNSRKLFTDDYSLKTDRNFVEISVEDTGIGIKPEDIDKIFKEFTQLESPYSKKHSGTGIGLILTKRLVELQGGRIWVESEWGKGSTLRFIIPRKVEQPVEQIIDPLTKLLIWKHFLKHFERIYSFCKRHGKYFGLLQIKLAGIDINSDYISVSEILRNTVRRHEILTHKDRGCYYLIVFDADRRMVENTASRISAVLKENGYDPVLKTAVFMEDGETIEEMLKILDNSDTK